MRSSRSPRRSLPGFAVDMALRDMRRKPEGASAHTPGPWKAEYSDPAEGADVWWICAGEGNSEKELGSFVGGYPHDRHEANARLAAAAPELLEALKDLPNILAEIHREWDRGQKAGKLLIALMDPSLNYRADITAIHAAIAKAEGR